MVLLPLFVVFAVAAVVTAVAVPLVTVLCRRQGWLAKPGPRHVHHVATPTLGGSAIFVGFVAALLFSFLLTRGPGPLQRLPVEHLRLLLLLAGATLVWLIATIDDIHPLPPLPRLVGHIVAALIAVGPYLWQWTVFPDPEGAHGIILTAFENPFGGQINLHRDYHPLLAIAVTVFWIVGMINTLNWIDGLDGLAAGVTLIAALILAIHTFVLHQYTLVMLPLMLAGACLGFLPFNFHPARIFMGDGGAMLLGYVLAISAIIGGAKLASALLVMGIPILDVAWLIVTRTLSGRRASESDRQHLHHRLYDLGFGQRQIVAFYYSISAIFGAIALLIPAELRLFKLVALAVLVVVLALVLLFATRYAKRIVTSNEG
ncbi:MAG: undecaprenyl/decaprenyl-phosphate alpha-N-acetylglucosaminyl 1-phosphate transferase [Herpetosiphonaceae bacterium]|nr:undecaprenyl/decaprenyl-phosphate alpha-N-acetylglucosaminyl 1-phosphate transferase [Herpetosiphonaceae bacterium]